MSKEISITQIIIMMLFVSMSIWIGMDINNNGKNITEFCYDHYRNETFLSNFIGNEPAVLKSCCLNTSESFGVNYCEEYVDDYRKCVVLNGTDDQRRFMDDCHWMGPDYFIMVGKLTFLFFIPIGIIGIQIAILYEYNKKRRMKK